MGCGAINRTPKGTQTPKTLTAQENIGPKEQETDRFLANDCNALVKSNAATAIKKKELHLVKQLVEKQSLKPNEQIGPSSMKQNCIHHAAIHNSFEIMKYLLSVLDSHNEETYPSIVNAQDAEGNSAAMLCCLYDSPETLYVVLSAGDVSVKVKNNEDLNLLDLASQHSPLCEQIISHFVDITKAAKLTNDNSSKTPAYMTMNSLTILDNTKDPDNNIAKIKAVVEQGEKRQQPLQLQTPSSTRNGNPMATLTSTINSPNNISLIVNDPDLVLANLEPNTKVYTTLKNCIQHKLNFKDLEFKTILSSICRNKAHEKYTVFQTANWLRPSEFLPLGEKIYLFNEVNPNDIDQGILGVCYFLSCLSVIAEYPSRLKKIFNNDAYNQYGAYSVNFYEDGTRVEVLIDDYFPCDPVTKKPMFSRPIRNELWVMILEKAWAKNFGDYCVTEIGYMDEAMEALTGAPSETIYLEDHDPMKVWSSMVHMDSENFILCAGTRKDVSQQSGLVQSHAYSILRVYDLGNIKLIKLRNPWGSFEWKGDFSDDSPLWTPELRERTETVQSGDGVFCMSLQDFTRYFHFISVCYVRDRWIYNSFPVVSQPNHAGYFEFKLEQDMELNFRLHQKDARYFVTTNPDYAYSGVAMVLAKKEADKLVFVSNGPSYYQRSTWMADTPFVVLGKGEYVLRVKVVWQNRKSNTFYLSSYSSSPINVVHTPRGKYASFLKNFIISHAQTMMLESPNDPRNEIVTKEIGNGCSCTVGWIRDSMLFFYCKNKSEKSHWILTITFKVFKNMKIGKYDKGTFRGDSIEVKILPKSDKCIYFKAQSGQKPEASYKMKSTWN